MFDNASAFNTPIGEWDVSSVEDMDDMSYEASAFNQDIGDLENTFSLEPSNEYHEWLKKREWPAVQGAMLHPDRDFDLLVRKYKERDEHGRLPHHCLAAKAQTHTHALASVGVYSIGLNYEALTTRDNKGETPLDIARRSEACAEIIGLLSLTPEEVRSLGYNEMARLHAPTGERAKRASLDEDERTRDESREIAKVKNGYIHYLATHSILLTRFFRFALASLKTRFAEDKTASNPIPTIPNPSKLDQTRHLLECMLIARLFWEKFDAETPNPTEMTKKRKKYGRTSKQQNGNNVVSIKNEANLQLKALLVQCDMKHGLAVNQVSKVAEVAEVAELVRVLSSSDGNDTNGIKIEDKKATEAYKKLLGDSAKNCE